MSQQQKAS